MSRRILGRAIIRANIERTEKTIFIEDRKRRQRNDRIVIGVIVCDFMKNLRQ